MDPVKHYNLLSIYNNYYKKQFFANAILLFSQSILDIWQRCKLASVFSSYHADLTFSKYSVFILL